MPGGCKFSSKAANQKRLPNWHSRPFARVLPLSVNEHENLENQSIGIGFTYKEFTTHEVRYCINAGLRNHLFFNRVINIHNQNGDHIDRYDIEAGLMLITGLSF
jgi:hypothetical protein